MIKIKKIKDVNNKELLKVLNNNAKGSKTLIDYSKTFRIKLSNIMQQNIKNNMSLLDFKVLCYCNCFANEDNFLNITPKIIGSYIIGIANGKCIESLNFLLKNNYLYGRVNKDMFGYKNKICSINDNLEVIINNDTDNFIPSLNMDYDSYYDIPINFCKYILTDMSQKEFALYCYLLIDRSIVNRKKIGNFLNIDRRLITDLLEELSSKNYITLKDDSSFVMNYLES